MEGLVVLVASVVLFQHLGGSLAMFALLLLLPDLAMLGYLRNARTGAATYNVVHNYALPLAVGAFAIAIDYLPVIPFVLIWTAHIGMDRAVGYGLKYPDAFGATHLGALGRQK